MSERHEIPKPDAVSPDDWDAMLDALERRHAARAASGLTLLTAEQRAWIERYTSFKTDASPITKAMRAAIARLDDLESENDRLRGLLSGLWSCFTCNHLGNCSYDENDDPCCPNCGTHDGDGFGMAQNDPRYKSDPQPESEGAR